MAATEEKAEDGTAKKTRKASKLLMPLSFLLFVASAGAGFFGASSGLLPVALPVGGADAEKTAHVADMPEIAFVPVPTMIVTLPPDARNAHLRFASQIEVPRQYAPDVEALMPRIQDLLNGYLRALTAEDIEGPGALIRLRAQMLRRILLVVGQGRANNLLVTEFILN